MPTKKRTSKPESAARKTPPIPREHPAFMLALGKAAFPTKPILRAWRRLRDAMRDGDKAAEERAVEHLSYMLHMPPEHEWLEKTGLPSPRDMEELKERMALAGFSPDTINSREWTPQSVSAVILGRGVIPDSAGRGVSSPRGVSRYVAPDVPPSHVSEKAHIRKASIRNRLWLSWYEDRNSPTYGSCAAIRDKWNSMKPAERAKCAPFDKLLRDGKRKGADTVRKGVNSARKEREATKKN